MMVPKLRREAAALLMLWALLALPCGAQVAGKEIDFKDLSRPGRPAVKVYPIPGLQKEAERWHESFSDSDRSERSEQTAAMNAHDAARTSCNQQRNCYSIGDIRSKRAVVTCNAGIKRGQQEWISIEGPNGPSSFRVEPNSHNRSS